MTAILSILTFLMAPWLFYGLCVSLSIWTYCLVRDEDDFPIGGLFVLSGLIAFVLYRFDHLWSFVSTWRGAVWTVAGYVATGGMVTLAKWIIVLVDFRPKAKEWLANPKAFDATSTRPKAEQLSYALYGVHGYPYRISEGRILTPKGLEGVTAQPSYYPNWREWPLATWWTYWPFFALSVILDPLTRAVRRALKWVGSLLENLSKAFSVS